MSVQARHIIHTSNLYMIEPQARLAKKINELTGFDVGVFFGNSGAEANEGAIKLARKYGEKKFANKKYKDRIQKDLVDALSLNIPGTPTFFFNGHQLKNDDLAGLKKQAEQYLLK
jgi:hypothetical protein